MATMNEYFLTDSTGEIIQELNAENDDVAKRACYSLAHELSDYVTCVRHICMAGPDDILRDAAERHVERTEPGLTVTESVFLNEVTWACRCKEPIWASDDAPDELKYCVRCQAPKSKSSD
jgi:hypothetical protein